jgi:hypothetical protein
LRGVPRLSRDETVSGAIAARPRRFVVFRGTTILHALSRGVSRTLCDLAVLTDEPDATRTHDEASEVKPMDGGFLALVREAPRPLVGCLNCRRHPSWREDLR